MKIILSQQALYELGQMRARDRANLVAALKILAFEKFPQGVFGGIKVNVVEARVFEGIIPPVHRLKVETPTVPYRAFYIVDEEHDAAFVAAVRFRDDKTYDDSPMYRAMIAAIIRDYFKEKRWENAR